MDNIATNKDTLVRETYASDDFIFFESDLENHFYIVETGKVRIFTKSKTGKRIDICTIEEGESFGEFALLDNKPRSASAQAIGDVAVIRVSAQGYEQLLSELPVWAASMMKSFVVRLRNMTEQMRASDQFIPKK